MPSEDEITLDRVPELVQPRWSAVYLVCKACSKRSKGPKHLKSKTLAALVRRASKHDQERGRVVMTGCLGLCPKSANALARVGPNQTRIVAIRSEREVAAVVERLNRALVAA